MSNKAPTAPVSSSPEAAPTNGNRQPIGKEQDTSVNYIEKVQQAIDAEKRQKEQAKAQEVLAEAKAANGNPPVASQAKDALLVFATPTPDGDVIPQTQALEVINPVEQNTNNKEANQTPKPSTEDNIITLTYALGQEKFGDAAAQLSDIDLTTIEDYLRSQVEISNLPPDDASLLITQKLLEQVNLARTKRIELVQKDERERLGHPEGYDASEGSSTEDIRDAIASAEIVQLREFAFMLDEELKKFRDDPVKYIEENGAEKVAQLMQAQEIVKEKILAGSSPTTQPIAIDSKTPLEVADTSSPDVFILPDTVSIETPTGAEAEKKPQQFADHVKALAEEMVAWDIRDGEGKKVSYNEVINDNLFMYDVTSQILLAEKEYKDSHDGAEMPPAERRAKLRDIADKVLEAKNTEIEDRAKDKLRKVMKDRAARLKDVKERLEKLAINDDIEQQIQSNAELAGVTKELMEEALKMKKLLPWLWIMTFIFLTLGVSKAGFDEGQKAVGIGAQH